MRAMLVLLTLSAALLLQTDGRTMNQHLGNQVIIQPEADAFIAGFFSFHRQNVNGQGCGDILTSGMQSYEAIRWALDRLNKKDEHLNGEFLDDYYIPGVKIGMIVSDYCSAVSAAVSIAENMFPQTGSSQTTDKHLLGLYVQMSSGDVMEMHKMAMDRNLSLVSYTSSSPALSDTDMFPNFMRTIPPDGPLTKTIVEFLNQLGWKYVVIVHTDSSYGREAYRTIRPYLADADICLTAAFPADPDDDSDATIDDLYDKVMSTNTTGVVYLGNNRLITAFLERGEVVDDAGKLQWVVTDSVSLVDTFPGQKYPRGLISVVPSGRKIIEFEEHWVRIDRANPSPKNLWYQAMYMESFRCRLPGVTCSEYTTVCPNKTETERRNEFVQDQFVEPAVHGVYIYARALKEAHTALCGGQPGMCQALKSLSASDFYQNYMRYIDFMYGKAERIESLASFSLDPYNAAARVKFDGNDMTNASFEVYNFNNYPYGLSYKFQSVGTYKDGFLQVIKFRLRYYDEPRDNVLPHIPLSNCPSEPCSPCMLQISLHSGNELMRQFLLYLHVLTTEEIESYAEDGVPENPPTLKQIKEQIDTYEKPYQECYHSNQRYALAHWFRIDGKPFKQALLNIIMCKHHLIDHVTNRHYARVQSYVGGMSTVESPPPEKRARTDFKYCLMCQTQTKEKLVDTNHKLFKDATYDSVFDTIQKKAELGSPECVIIRNRLHDATPQILKKVCATWHRTCRESLTRNAKREYQKAESPTGINSRKRARGRPSVLEKSVDTPAKKLTRAAETFDKGTCIYCQKNTGEDLIDCCSMNKGYTINDIINASDNDVWKVRLADVIASGDLHAKDVMYHKSCDFRNWEKYIQRPSRRNRFDNQTDTDVNFQSEDIEKCVKYQAAEVQFTSLLQQSMDNGEIIELPEAYKRYEQTLEDFGVKHEQESMYIFRTRILKRLNDVDITSSGQGITSMVHSIVSGASAIKKEAKSKADSNHIMKKLFDCAEFLRKKIKGSDFLSWKYNGSLKYEESEKPPNELQLFIHWLVHGPKCSESRTRNEEMNKSVNVLSQIILQNFKSDRQTIYSRHNSSTFYDSIETPLTVGLSLQSHHLNRTKNNIDILNAASVGVSYNRVTDLTTNIATSILKSIDDFDGCYVPPGLIKGVPIRASIDNIDKKVDTPDGKNSFHGTAQSVYQTVNSDKNHETVREKFRIDPSNFKPNALKDVPETVMKMVDCNIVGNPKPVQSPKYSAYSIGKHESESIHAENQDLTWLLGRFINRRDTVNEPIEENAQEQRSTIPVWRAYNSLLATSQNMDTNVSDQQYTLPIINASASDWITLVTVLENMYNLNQITCTDSSKVMVTFDMDLYKRALKLEYLNQVRYGGKWWLLPGPFHTSLCAIRCLGKTIEYSGIDDLWIKAGLYSEVVTNQVISGTHYNRAVEAHETTLQLFTDLWFSAFFESRQNVYNALVTDVKRLERAIASGSTDEIKKANQTMIITIESINLEKQLKDFDKEHEKYPMYKFYRMYIRQVMTLLTFHRSIKDKQLFLYLSSLEKLNTYFFAYNRLDYAQNIFEFIARAYAAKISDPEVWMSLMRGEFAYSSQNNIPFTSIGLDQAQEHQNKLIKGGGGISGLTTKPASFLKFCLAAPELVKISKETDTLIGNSETPHQKHHLLNKPVEERQEVNIAKLKKELNGYNPFKDLEDNLFNIVSKKVLAPEAKENILDIEERGKSAMTEFVDNRIKGDTNLWDKMTKVKVHSWSELNKRKKVKDNSQQQLNTTTALLSRMLIVAKSDRQLDLKTTVSNYEFHSVNKTLMKSDGSLKKCQNKSELKHLLEELDTESISLQPSGVLDCNNDNRHLIVDGMAVVQSVVNSCSKKISTCSEMSKVFVSAIANLAHTYYCTRVIFDNYQRAETIKDKLRYETEEISTSETLVEDETPVDDILSNRKTKDRLTVYLAGKLIHTSTNRIVSVTRESVESNNTDVNPTTPVSSQEEADTLMILHAVEIVQAGFSVDFFTQDTDWLVLLLRRHNMMGDSPRIFTGQKDSRKLILVTNIYNAIGEKKAKALPAVHALTGSDTTGHINGIGKKTALKCLFNECSDEELKSLAQLGDGDLPTTDTIAACMSYLCRLLSSQKICAENPGDLRWKTFLTLSSVVGIEKMPPTYRAWYQHILRAHLQANMWLQDILVDPVFLDPFKYGWEKNDKTLKIQPVLTSSDDIASTDTLAQLVKCNCVVSKCARRCTCKQNSYTCTELCKCMGNEDCLNTHPIVEDM